MQLDGKKWMRPSNFLPTEGKTAVAAEPPNPSKAKRLASTAMFENATCGSETSASTAVEISKVYKQNTIYDDFLFDIDEDQDFSMKSSSTLSTHSSLRQGTHDPYGLFKREPAKPFSAAKYEISEFSSRYLRTSILSISEQESPIAESGYLSSDHEVDNNLDEDFLTPEITLTQSSEECDPLWIDFPGFGSKNPFRVLRDAYNSNEHKPAHKQSSWTRQSHNIFTLPASDDLFRTTSFGANKSMVPISYRDEGTGNYTMYHEMLLHGISVDEVSKAMSKDKVDPSIISLVLAASESSQNY